MAIDVVFTIDTGNKSPVILSTISLPIGGTDSLLKCIPTFLSLDNTICEDALTIIEAGQKIFYDDNNFTFFKQQENILKMYSMEHLRTFLKTLWETCKEHPKCKIMFI